jgi:hypothetical protein
MCLRAIYIRGALVYAVALIVTMSLCCCSQQSPPTSIVEDQMSNQPDGIGKDDANPASPSEWHTTEFVLHDVSKDEFLRIHQERYICYLGHDQTMHYLLSALRDDVYKVPVARLSIEDMDRAESGKLTYEKEHPVLPIEPVYPRIHRSKEFEDWFSALKLVENDRGKE